MNISENKKLEYLEKLELQLIPLSEDVTLALCKDSDYYVRSRLAQVLVNYQNELSERILNCLLEDEDEIVRINACDSLCWSCSKKL